MKNATITTDLTPALQQDPTQSGAPLGFGNINPAANAPVTPSGWDQSEARRKREEAATAGNYLGSMWRQDSAVPGLIESYAGSTFVPQPDYFAGTAPDFKELSHGLWDEHVKELYQATSPAHALFLKDRLMQKQEDLLRLDDMGWKGNAARLALGLFSPDQLLMSMAGGWVTKAAVAQKAAQGTKLAQAAATAERVQQAGKLPAVAAGLGTAAAENAAYESLRQSVSFEDDRAAVLESGLMGALFASPFIAAGARADGRVAKAAGKEHEVLQSLKAVEDGADLTPAQVQTLREVHQVHGAIRDLEAGRIDEDQFHARLDEFHGPVEPHGVWMERWGQKLRDDTRSLIDELFPLQADPIKPPKVSPEMRAQMDARVAREDATFQPKEDLQAAGPVPAAAEVNAGNPHLQGALQSAFKRALMEREASRKAIDLEDAYAAAGDVQVQGLKAEREAAFQRAEEERAAGIKADQERMIRAREEARMLLEEDPLDAAVRRQQEPQQPAHEAASKPHPAAAWEGQRVSWAGTEGHTLEGTVRSFDAERGRLLVETDEGLMAVPPSRLDQATDPAPEGFLPGSIGAAQVAKIAAIADQRTAMSAARMDYFAILNRSEHEGVRSLAFDLIKDAIQVDNKQAQGWTASEHKKQLQRVVGGIFHKELNDAFRDAVEVAQVPFLQRGRFRTSFMELVTRETRGDLTVKADHPDLHPAIQKAAKAMRDTYARMLEEAQRAGVKGADQVPVNDLYVNRVWDHKGITDAIAAHGEDAVVSLLAHAIKVPGYTGDKVKAKRFLDTVRRLEFSGALESVHLQSRDMGTLRTELAAHGMDSDDIDTIIDVMFDARAASGGDAGQAGNLRFRFDLDETATARLPTGTLRLSDLLENDARVLMDTYINSMGGHIGLARVGINSQAAWVARLKEVEDEALAQGVYDGARLAKELGYLKDIHSHITGRPLGPSEFNYTARTLAALRGYTRAVMLGQLGLTAAFEMSRAVSLMGFRAVWQSLPTFRGFITALRQGHLPEAGLAEDILHMTGFGTEMASSYARAHELESGFAGGALTRFEKGANTVAHVSDVVSGNASFTSITRQLTAMAVTRQAFGFAAGKRTLTPELRRRWVAQGVDDMDIDSMLYDLERFAVAWDGVLQGIRYEDWAREALGSYQRFQLFLSRQVRDAIQDQDFGETMPFMHTTAGKVLAELRTFMLVGHAKNMLKNLHFRDSTAAQLWMVSFVSECLAYSTQTAINYPTELDERLTPDRIASSALSRMSINGLAPLLAETAYNIGSGGDSLFQPGATANTDNRVLWRTPSMVTASRLWNAPMVLSGMLGTDETTAKEVRELADALPFKRLYGLPAFANWLAETYPKTDPEKAYGY
ncbi:hypothetical protein [Azohydromonas caseinilytica]|uniref:Uncharacterized protein n=1 Tax=Azohydromonas caseinilytica TaxID=2728836 RepID=A0A848FBM1_9BURK|nr:hypothetical protein [Azohydromonas caseinilytica]NML15590.1 hypothetical protein [Azohydromonas caseinilytica]